MRRIQNPLQSRLRLEVAPVCWAGSGYTYFSACIFLLPDSEDWESSWAKAAAVGPARLRRRTAPVVHKMSVGCRGTDQGTFKNAAWVPPSPTLYMTNIPASRNALEALEDVMKQQEGFIPPMRQAKGGAIAFADFSSVQMATNAMHRLRGLQVGGGVEKGINFSYDKDDSEEKRKEKESRQLLNQAMSKCQQYNCRLCGISNRTLFETNDLHAAI